MPLASLSKFSFIGALEGVKKHRMEKEKERKKYVCANYGTFSAHKPPEPILSVSLLKLPFDENLVLLSNISKLIFSILNKDFLNQI